MTSAIRAVTGVGLVILAAVVIAATRPPATIDGRPTVDRAQIAEVTFPYPHLSILRITGDGLPDEARLLFDDGTVAVGTQVAYQVPANGEPFQVATDEPLQDGQPTCDKADQICWGPTTVEPWLNTRVELTYVGVPCVITGSPVDRTTIDCSEPE